MYDELHRPQFHFSPRHSWMNDPNGLVYYRGEYHLFFQHTPGFMNHAANSWGHAVSTDLVHWRELDTAIAPDEYGFIWSGSAVVDTDNSAGFADGGGEQALVAVYTTGGFGAPRPDQPGATPCVQAHRLQHRPRAHLSVLCRQPRARPRARQQPRPQGDPARTHGAVDHGAIPGRQRLSRCTDRPT